MLSNERIQNLISEVAEAIETIPNFEDEAELFARDMRRKQRQIAQERRRSKDEGKTYTKEGMNQ